MDIDTKGDLQKETRKLEIETDRGKDFINKYGSKRSKRVVKSRLKKYLVFTNSNCDQLVREINEDRRKEAIDREYETERKVNEFVEWLEDLGYSSNMRATTMGTIRAFYKFHGFPLHTDRLKKVVGKSKQKNRVAHLTKEKMAQLYNATPSKRNKALLLLLYQTGQGREQISELNYGDVADELKEGKSPLMIDYGGRKGHVNDYCTFLGADGIHALEAYLDERREKLEGSEHLSKKGDLYYEAPLLAKRNGVDRLTPGAISEVLKYIARNTDVISDEKMEYADFNPLRPHAFRHNFKTHLTPYVSSFIIEYMMGHSLGTEGEYFINEIGDREALRKYYAENIEDHLSIQTTSIEKEAFVSEEFEDLKADKIRSIVGEEYYSKEEVEGIRNGLKKEKDNLRKELLSEIREQEKKIAELGEELERQRELMRIFGELLEERPELKERFESMLTRTK